MVHAWTPGGLIEKWNAASVSSVVARGNAPGCTARILPTKTTFGRGSSTVPARDADGPDWR